MGCYFRHDVGLHRTGRVRLRDLMSKVPEVRHRSKGVLIGNV